MIEAILVLGKDKCISQSRLKKLNMKKKIKEILVKTFNIKLSPVSEYGLITLKNTLRSLA